MHRKGLYKIAIEWPWSKPSKPKVTPPEHSKWLYTLPKTLPPPGTAPAGERLLETPAYTLSLTADGRHKNPFNFMLYDRQDRGIPVNTMTDTPYFFNTVRWQPPTDRTFNYSEFYNAQVDDPQGWAKYQEYRRNIPLEDINKVTKVPQHDANIRGTDQYSSADDFVNTVGQGPSFRWYNAPTSEDAEKQGSQPGHVAIYALSSANNGWAGLYSPGWRPAPYGYIQLSKDPVRTSSTQFHNRLDGEYNGIVGATYGILPSPQMITAGHEMSHALTHASKAPGTDYRRPGPMSSVEAHTSLDSNYSYRPVEQVQAAHTLNKSYQALLNSIAKGNHKDMPSEFRKIVSAYPAYGSKEQFMARNDALLAHPELAVKYLGVEPSRALAQYKQLKHNAWLQRNGWFLTTPRVRDAQTHLDFFNDNYFADASFNGNAAQRTV